jgi:hypothetical protein
MSLNATTAVNAERPWLGSYPPGVPTEIDADKFASINDVFLKSCEKFRNLTAFSCMGKSMSFGELDRQTLALAGYLSGVAKLEKGDRVAIMMPNILQYPLAVFGILRAGLVVVNCNPLYTPRELERQYPRKGDRQNRPQARYHHAAWRSVGVSKSAGGQLRNQAQEKTGAAMEFARLRHVKVCLIGRQSRGVYAACNRQYRSGIPAIHGRHDRRFQGGDAHPP